MIQAKCIQKFRDKNNHIYGYRLVDINGQTQDVQPNNLKQAIANKQIHVVNLTLTSDGRLVDTNEKQLQSKKLGSAPQRQISEEEKIKAYIQKNKGTEKCKEIPVCYRKYCYLISKSSMEHIIYIPDGVTDLNDEFPNNLKFTDHIKYLNGTIKVVGGHTLTETKYMFYKCTAQSIDLSSFDTSNVENMFSMFYECKAKSINLKSLNTGKVEKMGRMFAKCEASIIDISSFNIINVTDMCKMFEDCMADLIDMTSLSISHVDDIRWIFAGCLAEVKATDQIILDKSEYRGN